jgi:hypothetical protein
MGNLDEGLDLLLKKLSKNCKGSAEERRTCNGKKQIPCGNDRKKGNSNSKGQNAGISTLRRQKTPPRAERTDGGFSEKAG